MRTVAKRFASIAFVQLVAIAAAGEGPQRVREAFTLPTPAEAKSFAMAKSGSLAVAGCGDHKLRVWTLPEARIVRTIDLASHEIDVVAMSDNGRWILTAAHDGDVRVWDSSNGQIQLQIRLARYPLSAVFSHNSNVVAIDPADEPVQVYDLPGRRKMYDLNQALTEGPSGLAFSRDGSLIAAAGSDTSVSIYNARTGKLISRNTDFLLEPFTVDFTPDDKQVVTGGADKIVAFVDTITGRTIRRMERAADVVAYLGISPDGKFLASLRVRADLSSPSIIVWEMPSGQQKAAWLPPAVPLGYAGTWTADGRLLFATATSDAVHIWRIL
jgi:WD40 repeat protein